LTKLTKQKQNIGQNPQTLHTQRHSLFTSCLVSDPHNILNYGYSVVADITTDILLVFVFHFQISHV